MSRWFRHYAGMMRDDKLVRVAIRANQPVERVVWVWGAILESAAEIDDNGRFDVDAAEVAYFLRADQTDIDAIMDGLADLQRISSGAVVNWGDRQFSSDKSKERVAAYRERQRAKSGGNQGKSNTQDVTVTACNDDVTAQETDTDTEEKLEANASSKKGDPRGTRLPEDWQPKPLTGKTAEMVAAWPVGMLERELSKFRDHYLKTPGARGRSLDWDASYRNWLRIADERKPNHGPSNPLARHQSADGLSATTRAARAVFGTG